MLRHRTIDGDSATCNDAVRIATLNDQAQDDAEVPGIAGVDHALIKAQIPGKHVTGIT